MKVRYSNKALSDLDRIHAFIANKNSKAAHRISKEIVEKVRYLVDFPLLGRKVSLKLFSRDLIIEKYIVRYAIKKDIVYILRIWHGKENKEQIA